MNRKKNKGRNEKSSIKNVIFIILMHLKSIDQLFKKRDMCIGNRIKQKRALSHGFFTSGKMSKTQIVSLLI